MHWLGSYNHLQKCWDTPTKKQPFKSLLVTGLWGIILTSLLPSIQSYSFKFWACSCIASDFDKGWGGGGHKHKIMGRTFKPIAKYDTVSPVRLQLAVNPPLLFFRFLLFLRDRAPPRECRPVIGMAYGVFSHDVTAAILLSQNNKKRRPCWCPKLVLWELNSFLMQTLSFVVINLLRCWPREWKHSIKT